jgi:hypothetical protein
MLRRPEPARVRHGLGHCYLDRPQSAGKYSRQAERFSRKAVGGNHPSTRPPPRPARRRSRPAPPSPKGRAPPGHPTAIPARGPSRVAGLAGSEPSSRLRHLTGQAASCSTLPSLQCHCLEPGPAGYCDTHPQQSCGSVKCRRVRSVTFLIELTVVAIDTQRRRIFPLRASQAGFRRSSASGGITGMSNWSRQSRWLTAPTPIPSRTLRQQHSSGTRH